MNENENRIREILEEEKVPEEISPERIKEMLDAQVTDTGELQDEAAAGKRKGISVGGRIAAAAAACAIIAGGAGAAGKAGLFRHMNAGEQQAADVQIADDDKKPVGTSAAESAASAGDDKDKTETVRQESFMNSASSYGEIYKLIKDTRYELTYGRFGMDDEAEYVEEEAVGAPAMNSDADIAEKWDYSAGTGGSDEGGIGFTDTYDQEEGVREADIVKTDGKNIYSLCNYGGYYSGFGAADPIMPKLNITAVDSGKITSVTNINIADDIGKIYGEEKTENVSVQDMYLYNDMIAVIGNVSGSDEVKTDEGWSYYEYYRNTAFVSFYAASDSHEYLGTCFQDGSYRDVRITPEGYMYIITSYSNIFYDSIESEDDIDNYIPAYGTDKTGLECLEPECILLPDTSPEKLYSFGYTVIGSIDLTTPGSFRQGETKALAGYTGDVYCSADNLYTTYGWEETEVTRISLSGGSIVPAASCKIKGSVKDQFSMSEYGGYFRVASTETTWHFITDVEEIRNKDEIPAGRSVTSNYLYVLDMNLNQVSCLTGFGENEYIRSVSFSGDKAYVVTYEQTDPLFAIDLSDPASPKVMDELKLPGYSTYMQKWDEDHLFGFGINANENGRETGVKAVMFDNSDPYDLKEVGIYTIDRKNDDEWVSSDAVWERKCLLIEPEKNIIGFPVYISTFDTSGHYSASYKYVFLSYEGGQFTLRGEISQNIGDDSSTEYSSYNEFQRAVRIDDNVYVISGRKIIAADIDTLTVTDTANLI